MSQRKTFLLIDGAYYSNRTLHGERISNPEMTMETNHDFMRFEYLMIRNLVSTIKAFKQNGNDILDSVVLCFDSFSWRKEYEPHTPYFVDLDAEGKPTEPIKYKENRVEKKKASDIDWDGFNQAQDDFAAMIKSYIPTLKVEGLEADDLLYLLSKQLSEQGHNVIILATDGDLIQLVNDRVSLFKDVRSKNSPDGEVYISQANFDLLYGNYNTNVSALSRFIENNNKGANTGEVIEQTNYLQSLVGVKTTGNNRRVSRIPNQQVFVENKYKTLFYKCVEGDLKDNIFSILRWPASTGSRNYRCTDKYISKVIALLGYEDVEQTYKDLLNLDDPDMSWMMQNFLLNLIHHCIPKDKPKDNLFYKKPKQLTKHLRHNIKLNILSEENIPVKNQQWYQLALTEIDLNNSFDVDAFEIDLMKQNIGGTSGGNSSANILTQSAPAMSDILKDIL